MKNNAEKLVSRYYKEFGWNTNNHITEDARKFEDLREHAVDYVSKCRQRIMAKIPDKGDRIIDMASGPVQYPEYIEYSKGFKKRYCVDYSEQALKDAEKKLGEHGEYLCGNFLQMNFRENFFDCAISLHTIYHIDKDEQELAIRKLISITKPGKPIIIVYSNPMRLVRYFLMPFSGFKEILTWRFRSTNEDPQLYVYRHPLKWWNQFEDCAEVKVLPWRSFSAEHQRLLVPNNRFGSWIFEKLFMLENRFPRFFAKWFQYPMIILHKNIRDR